MVWKVPGEDMLHHVSSISEPIMVRLGGYVRDLRYRICPVVVVVGGGRSNQGYNPSLYPTSFTHVNSATNKNEGLEEI